MTDPTTDPATEALDHFDVDLDDDDLTDTTTTDVDDTENEPSTNGDTTPSDDDGVADDGEVDGPEPVKGPEPVEVRRARRALKTARAEHRGAISRLRLAEERVVNANGAVKVAAAKAVDLEADEKKKPTRSRPRTRPSNEPSVHARAWRSSGTSARRRSTRPPRRSLRLTPCCPSRWPRPPMQPRKQLLRRPKPPPTTTVRTRPRSCTTPMSPSSSTSSSGTSTSGPSTEPRRSGAQSGGGTTRP